MRARRALVGCVLAAILALLIALPSTASAIEIREGDTVSVARGEVLSDDLYAFGNTISIDGIVDGDVVAFGQVVYIGGDVTGSIISAAQTVRVDGTVDGSVRAAGATVDVDGIVDGDVLAGANQVNITGSVARDVAAGGQSVRITGTVGRNVLSGSESLVIEGTVGGDVEAQSNDVTVASQGSVEGDLDYWSESEAEIQGDVAGTATRHQPVARAERSPGPGPVPALFGVMLAWVQSFVGFIVLGLVMIFAIRQPAERGSRAVIARFWSSLGVGALVWFGTPMAAGFIFVIGLFFGLWWLSFVLLAVFWLLLLAGVVVGSLAVGRAILGKASKAGEPALGWSLVLGVVLVWMVAVVPVFGWLAAWAVMLAGTGALVLTWLGKDVAPVTPAVTAGSAPAPVAPPVVPPPAG